MNTLNIQIENDALRKVVEEQANFYIDWHYDYLVRKELDNNGNCNTLSQEQKTCLKQEAINSYMASNENYLQDLRSAGA